MTAIKRISLSLPEDLIKSFDKFFQARGQINRSRSIELILRDYLNHASLAQSQEQIGILLVIYDARDKQAIQTMAGLQRRFKDIIHSSQSIITAQDSCYTSFLVQGKAGRIEKLSQGLLTAKGVKLGRSLLNPV